MVKRTSLAEGATHLEEFGEGGWEFERCENPSQLRDWILSVGEEDSASGAGLGWGGVVGGNIPGEGWRRERELGIFQA